MNTADVNEVRKHHRPREACSCGRWECCLCGTTWPCDTERGVRAAGFAPVGIYAYGRGEHLITA